MRSVILAENKELRYPIVPKEWVRWDLVPMLDPSRLEYQLGRTFVCTNRIDVAEVILLFFEFRDQATRRQCRPMKRSQGAPDQIWVR